MDDAKDRTPRQFFHRKDSPPPEISSPEAFLAQLAALAREDALPRRKRHLHYYRRRLRLRILIPVTVLCALLVTAALLSARYTLCYCVVAEGSRVAYIRAPDTYRTAVSQVEEQVSALLQDDYQYRKAAVLPALAPKQDVADTTQLTDALLDTVDQVEPRWLLTVDGVPVGNCKTRREINDALQQVKALYTNENTAALTFDSVLNVTQAYLPCQEEALDAGALAAAFTAPTDRTLRYCVQEGDTLAGIAQAHSLTEEAVARENPDCADPLTPGTVLTLCTRTPVLTVRTQDVVTYPQAIPFETQTQEDDTLETGQTRLLQAGAAGQETVTARISYLCGREETREILSAQVVIPAVPAVTAVGTKPVQAATGTFLWPCKGEITSAFGMRYLFGATAFHRGLDIADCAGSPLYASDSGTVCFAGEKGTYGNLIMVDHGNGYLTYYGHCSAIGVSVGQWVTQGEEIGQMGQTGRATGPHCHFEIRWQNQPLDPKGFLP